MITPNDKDIIFDNLRKCLMRNKDNIEKKIRSSILSNMLHFLNHLVGEDKSRYQIATEVFGEYAEQMAKEYDYTPCPVPFQNWLILQEEEEDEE